MEEKNIAYTIEKYNVSEEDAVKIVAIATKCNFMFGNIKPIEQIIENVVNIHKVYGYRYQTMFVAQGDCKTPYFSKEFVHFYEDGSVPQTRYTDKNNEWVPPNWMIKPQIKS